MPSVNNSPAAMDAFKETLQTLLNGAYSGSFPLGMRVVKTDDEETEAKSSGLPYIRLTMGANVPSPWSSGARPRRQITIEGKIVSNPFNGAAAGVENAASGAIEDAVLTYWSTFETAGLYRPQVEFQTELAAPTSETNDEVHQNPFTFTASYFLTP